MEKQWLKLTTGQMVVLGLVIIVGLCVASCFLCQVTGLLGYIVAPTP